MLCEGLLANSSPTAKGTSVIVRSVSYASGASSRSGSSRKSRVPGGSFWQNDAASATDRRWWYSMPRVTPCPTASRIFGHHFVVMPIEARGSKIAVGVAAFTAGAGLKPRELW